jgi:hypothetical protein
MLFAVGSETYTVTLITSLQVRPGFHIAIPRRGINCSIDFLEDVIDFMDRGLLRRGDYLVRAVLECLLNVGLCAAADC